MSISPKKKFKKSMEFNWFVGQPKFLISYGWIFF